MIYFDKAKKAANDIYMCIRYPFLYPRNRFTGKHYNNWKLHQYHVDHYKEAIGFATMHIVMESDMSDEYSHVGRCTPIFKSEDGTTFRAIRKYGEDRICVYAGCKKIYTIKLKDITTCENYNLLRIVFSADSSAPSIYVVFSDDSPISNDRRLHFIKHVKNPWLMIKIKAADFLNDYVLQLFHCIPTSNEWYAMEGLTGWNKAFGRQLLKDMKKQLIKDHMLFKFRIVDIKEKYGTLRIYCGGATKEMHDLLYRYESLSSHTCIECGKPAKYISGGWICPYCEDCIGDRRIEATVDDDGCIHYIDEKEEE